MRGILGVKKEFIYHGKNYKKQENVQITYEMGGSKFFRPNG